MFIWSRHGRAFKIFNHRWSQLIFIPALVMSLCPLGRVTGQRESETQSPAQVLQDLLARHGENSTITVPQLRALLALLSQNQDKGDENSGKVAETIATTPPKSNMTKVRTKIIKGDSCFVTGDEYNCLPEFQASQASVPG